MCVDAKRNKPFQLKRIQPLFDAFRITVSVTNRISIYFSIENDRFTNLIFPPRSRPHRILTRIKVY